ncbi:hypothetical protein F2Q69_00022996 [Brassica cretica]|uniref:Uncharacterized protein n=1 Tax=Brassica cretica TaxID=69181 RepID=A0A8S9Q884_BRACR|nr:hypothetical protein F2Q69_00022996 [Brassica cretica]
MMHEEFAARHPHPPNPLHININRQTEPLVDRQQETTADRQPLVCIDRREPLTFRVQMPKIDSARINALRPQPKPSANPPETTSTHSDDAPEPMEVDKAPMRRTLRKRKEKVAKHLKRGANEKEMESFLKRVLMIPPANPFEETCHLTTSITNKLVMATLPTTTFKILQQRTLLRLTLTRQRLRRSRRCSRLSKRSQQNGTRS